MLFRSKKIETIGLPLSILTKINSGIATLKDKLFFVDEKDAVNSFYKKLFNGTTYLIPKAITKPMIKISEMAIQDDIKKNTLRIIFPYEWIDGSTLYDHDSIQVWDQFLNFAENNLWKVFETTSESFNDLCKNFYYTKTFDRLELFLDRRDKSFAKKHIVNGSKVKSIYELLNQFNWEHLFEGIPTKLFHGDLQFDNVLYGNDQKFYLLDWRQDFGGDIKNGDIYYDLAKLNHNLIFNHDIVHKNLFFVTKNDHSVKCDILRSNMLTNCLEKIGRAHV